MAVLQRAAYAVWKTATYTNVPRYMVHFAERSGGSPSSLALNLVPHSDSPGVSAHMSVSLC